VNDAAVAPVKDGNASLIPLPLGADPDAVLKLDLKLAAKSPTAERIRVETPIVSAPVMLAEWQLKADPGQRLVYRSGSLTPVGGVMDGSGFAQLTRVFSRNEQGRPVNLLVAALALLGLALLVWRWTIREGVYKFSARHMSGLTLGLGACVLAAVALLQLAEVVDRHRNHVPGDVTFVAPVQQASSALNVEVSNIPERSSDHGFMGYAWPALFAPLIWIYGWSRRAGGTKAVAWIAGWTPLAWAALRWPDGGSWFFTVIGAFLLVQVLIPALRRLRQIPSAPKPAVTAGSAGGEASAATALLIGALIWSSLGSECAFAAGTTNVIQSSRETVLAESVIQEIRIEDRFALATAKIRWHAKKGQTLPVLFEPAVLTHSSTALKIMQTIVNARWAHLWLAREKRYF